MSIEQPPHIDPSDESILHKVRPVKVLVPLVIGLTVVLLLLRQQFDWEQWNAIDWSLRLSFWIGVAAVLLIIRHLAYAYRLYTLSNGAFSFWKSVQLIFIWEFSSAVSPTSLGGSAVALVVLAQENMDQIKSDPVGINYLGANPQVGLNNSRSESEFKNPQSGKTARVAAIVIYTVVLDTAFFILTLPILYMLVGAQMIQPGALSLADVRGLGGTFIVAYILMSLYGLFFLYGLFYNPSQFNYILKGVSKIGFLKRWKENILKTGEEIVVASQEIKKEKWPFHTRAILATITAWSCRFLVLSAVIIAFTPAISLALEYQIDLFARLESMFVIIAFSPTPGGSGFVEVVTSNFIQDYAGSNSLLVAFIWRLMAYYTYLIAGTIIVPIWIRNVFKKRKNKEL